MTLAAAALLLSGCTDSPQDVMATATCPTPLHRVLVATQTSAPGSNGVVGASTPSSSIDPAEQHPITATATFLPDSDNSAQGALPVTATFDSGTGSGINEAETCQVLSLHLTLDAGKLSTPYGQVQPGRLHLVNGQGTGSVQLVDQPTYIHEADNGSGVQDYGSITGWLLLVEEPVAGRYRTQQSIRWKPVPRPAVDDASTDDDTTRASTQGSLTGTVDVEITIG